ncbi:Ubiquitin carboxyl-terminal hydrolase 31 [Sparganum proliferum]
MKKWHHEESQTPLRGLRYKVKSSDSLKFSDTKPYKMTNRKPNSKHQRSDEGHKLEDGTVVAAGAGVQSENVADPEFADLPQPLPPGFHNLGNTCYINTTLQCLLTVHPLLQWLLKVDKQGNSSSSSIPSDPRLTDSLSDLVAATFRRKYKSELQKFRELVGVLQPEFKEAREQDAQEFLLLLLNRLHEENVLPSSPSTAAASGSEVQRIFAGEMRTSVVCSKCRDPTQEKTSFFHRKPTSECSTGEVFLSLSLPIPLQEEQIDEATLGSDPRHLRHRIVLNELIQQPKVSRRCFTVSHKRSLKEYT